MKKLLLSLSVILSATAASAQVIVAGVSPQNIVANYTHTWADPAGGWGTPDFTIPGTFVQDTLQLADDGSTGLNAQGNPVSASGCNALTPGSLAGKIAVVFRGDGTTNPTAGACEFGLKAFNAQNAGAVAVIIVNRNPNEVISMGPGADGANVTIPVVMIDLNDGATLTAEMANGPVVMFLGNKTGLFANDIALSAGAALAPKAGMVHSLLAQNGTEFNFEVGAKVTNPGNQAQSNISLNAKVTNPSGVIVYDNTVSGLTLNAEDTTGIDIFPDGIDEFPPFSLSSYPVGTYTLTYTAFNNTATDYIVSIDNAGQGYISGNNVSTTGGSGTGMTVNFSASPISDSVISLNNLNPGENYINSIGSLTTSNGNGSGLTLDITAETIGEALMINALSSGSNYVDSTGAPTLPIVGSGFGLTLDITAETIGEALMINALSSGSNYVDSTGAPTLPIVGSGFGLTVGFTSTNGSIDSLFIVNGGSGYEINDTIQILAGDSTATFIIDSVSLGQIINYSINNPGSGYEINDTIQILAGDSTATFVIDSVSLGQIINYSINNPGSGYLVGDSITILGGLNGSFLVSSVGISGGEITSVSVSDLGQGYSTGDIIQIGGGNGASISIDTIQFVQDNYNADNTINFNFTVNDSVYSYTTKDATTGSLTNANFYRPGTNNDTYSICAVINDPNASRVAATGLYFAATTAAASGVTLDGEEMALYLYQWDDSFTDLNDPNFGFTALTEVATGFYYYPSDLQEEVVYGAFTNPVVLVDNQRYLACVQTVNLDLYLGYGNQDYTWNTDVYLQPMFPNESDGTYFGVGFGTELPSALGVALIDANDVSIAEANVVEGMAYPNPANDKVTVSIEGEGVASLKVTDVSGKTVMTNSFNLVGGKSDVSISSLDAGMYIFNVILENGKTAQFNVVKK